MGHTRMLKAILLLAWLWMARESTGEPQQAASMGNNRQSGISNKPRCTNGLEENAPCEEDVDYSDSVKDRFRFLLRRFGGKGVVTNEVFLDLSQPEEIDVQQINGARDPNFNYEPLCAFREDIFMPKRAKTRNNEWVFVLNQEEHRQAVKVEKCINNRPCSLGSARTEVNTMCRQKFVYSKLLVMNSAGSDIVPESVVMPSTCVCFKRKERNQNPFASFRTRGQFGNGKSHN